MTRAHTGSHHFSEAQAAIEREARLEDLKRRAREALDALYQLKNLLP